MVILSQAAAIARRILTELVRGRRSLVFWAVFPALMLVLFGTIHAGGRHTGVSFDRTAPGILIGAALFFSCLGGTVSLLAAERERRTLRRLFLSPLAPAAYLMGVTLAFLTVGAGQGLLVYGVSLAFGGRFHGSGLLGALIVGLTVCAYVGLGAFFGARFAGRTEDVNGPVAAFGVPLLVLGGTFFSTSVLPPGLFLLAQLDPVFHMNEALKGVWGEGRGLTEILPNLAALAAFTVLALGLGVRSFHAMLARERRG